MFTFIVIFGVCTILSGMALSVWFFGTGGKRANIFKDIYFTVEDVDGIGVIYTKLSEYGAVIKINNPVQKFSADVDSYYSFTALMTNVMKTLGDGYAVQKQDIFVRKQFSMPESDENSYLTNSYFRFFDGRTYVDCDTYLIIVQENKKSALMSFDAAKWRDFLVKINKVRDQLIDGGIKDARFLSVKECKDYVDRYFAMNFRDRNFSMTNFKVDSDVIGMGERQMKMFSLIDVDNAGLPGILKPYVDMNINNSMMPVDIMSELDKVPEFDTMVYNQILFLPNQKRELSQLEKKKNRHTGIPSPGNLIAAEDIGKVLDVIAREGHQLVYSHFSLAVSISKDADMQKVTNHIENLMSRQNIHISKHAYNQLELFVASFPGNCFRLNPDYDRFLTLSDAALCLMYKECQAKSEDTKLKCYYTDRQGVPLALDITGKEGKIKYTDNSNFFVLGPSGSGKSFFMNTVCRQLYEQNTDLVIVDTGDSYEMLNTFFGGMYISYSKEKPISMNPFKINITEYTENFGEKKNFLSSLIFLIFKGSSMPTKIEEYIINKTIVEYYTEYWTPFDGFNDAERESLRESLILQAKKDGTFEEFEKSIDKELGGEIHVTDEDRQRYEKLKDREEKLQAVIDDSGASEGEKSNARKRKEQAHNELMRMNSIVETKFGSIVERQIARIEDQRKKLRVKTLSFNSYYEYAIQRIPQICSEEKITFAINDFAAILKPFYKGGELEYTLNNDMDSTLFDERFIVFEIDKIKEDPVLFPIVVLIIMDVFTQKMRIKSNCRKCLVIEEAWKAIATPIMAQYIQYLYKTARKHWAMVGVVTQELQDIVSSPIVKEAIINNSDVFMLLDQSKFKDKFTDIKATLALSDIECKKIFTINRLDNKVGRSPFKEVFIKRRSASDVYGVEEPRECYITYTTEKKEKEALKLYHKLLGGSYYDTLKKFISDWERSGIVKSLDFATKVIEENRLLY